MSRLENVLDDPLPIDDSFPDEQLPVINASRTAPWYADYAIGAVLGQRVDKKLNVIQYASKTLDNAQRNYATSEKRILSSCICL